MTLGRRGGLRRGDLWLSGGDARVMFFGREWGARSNGRSGRFGTLRADDLARRLS